MIGTIKVATLLVMKILNGFKEYENHKNLKF